MRKLILLIPIVLFIISVFIFKQELILNAQSRPEFTLEVSSDITSLLPEREQDAILLALNQRWTGPTPHENKFYIPSLRHEPTWILAELYFRDAVLPTPDSSNSALSNSFLMIIVLDNSNKWTAALADEPLAADLARLVPDMELDFNAKTTLFKYFPSQFKTTSTNVDYKFPWSSSETPFFFSGYRTINSSPCTNNSSWHGVKAFHGGQSCHGLDFAPQLSPEVTNANILSPVSGYVTGLCKNTGELKQSAITIKATNSNEIIGLYHIDKHSMPASINLGTYIKQGDVLGQMVEGNVNELISKCSMVSEGTHLHLVAPKKPFQIDGYTFTEENQVIYKEVSYTMKEYQNRIINSSNGSGSCTPPSVGDWTITNTCNVTSSVQLDGSIIINSAGALIINENASVDLNFNVHKILIKDGGKLLVKPGSKIF